MFTPASTITVNTTAQTPNAGSDCTLGDAIRAANTDLAVNGCAAGSGVDTIVLPAGTYTLSNYESPGPFGPSALPLISSEVIIQGSGAEKTVIERDPAAIQNFRILALNQSSGTLVLNDVTLRGGLSDDDGGALHTLNRPVDLNRVSFDGNTASFGGAVAGNLNAIACTFTNNRATSSGGALYGVVLRIAGSTFNNNKATTDGGAIFYNQSAQADFVISDSSFTHNTTTNGRGGAISSSGIVLITGSTFDSNTAHNQSGAIEAAYGLDISNSVITNNHALEAGGISFSPWPTIGTLMSVDHCNISNNTAERNAGGIRFEGGVQNGSGSITNSTISGNTAGLTAGGIYSDGAALTLSNVTIDGNTSGDLGGAIFYRDGNDTRPLNLNNVTITSNRSTNNQGGGLFRGSGNVYFRNSIMALNTSASIAPDIGGTSGLNSLGYNLIGIKDGGAAFTSATGDQVGSVGSPIDPHLGALQDNGGPTFTRALLAGSPAIDMGSPGIPGSGGDTCEPADQRGTLRPKDGDASGPARCDIGGFEVTVATACVTPPSGLVGWWPLDGDANDIVGGNAATLTGNPSFDPGKVAESITFDGLDDHAKVAASALLDVGAGNGLTVDVWIKTPEISTPRPLFEWSDGAGIEGVHVWIAADASQGGQGPGSIFVNLIDAGGAPHIISTAPGMLTANAWQHVAVTYDKTNGVATIYLNGLGVKQQTLGVFTPQTTTDLYFGYRTLDPLAGRRFLGQMDEIEVFNRALAPDEIQAIYDADSAGKCKPAPSPSPSPSPSPAVLNVAEQVVMTDALRVQPATLIALSENISVNDATVPRPAALVGVNENVFVNDATLPQPAALIGVNENISISDATAPRPAALIGLNENILVNDATAAQPAALIGLNEKISVSDATKPQLAALVGIKENISVLDKIGLPSPAISVPTSVGPGVVVQPGTATITFSRVTAPGVTTITPIDPSSAGQLPGGFSVGGFNLAFDVSTTATYSPPIGICFNIGSVTNPALFAKLKVLHKENGVLVNRTSTRTFATRTICAKVPSLSPFLIAESLDSPLEDPEYFVRQHYFDFLGRDADGSGLQFWTDQIAACDGDPQCIELKRINVSAAYFLSIEFQESGFLVYRFYNAALNRPNGLVRYAELLADSSTVGKGVVVLAPGWESQLEANKVSFATEFAARTEFTNLYPANLTPAGFVDALYEHALITPSANERQASIGEFGGASSSADTAARGRALRRLAENQTLSQREFNRAFVLAEYFGYLRRNPDDAPDNNLAGYNFWLNKLNQFKGNFVEAEMVKAFLTSGEYQRRFGP